MSSREADRRPPELMLLIGGGEGYGVARILRECAAELRGRGWSLGVLSAGPGPLAEAFAEAGVPVETFSRRPAPRLGSGFGGKLLGLARLSRGQLARYRWLAGRLAHARPRLVIVSNPLDVLLAGVAARNLPAARVWLMPNSVAGGYPLDLNRRLYGLAIRRFGVRPLANSAHTLRTLGPFAGDGAVVHLGLGAEWTAPLPPAESVRRDPSASPDEAVFGIFARLVEEKGQAMFLRALQRVRPGLDGCRVLLCGGPVEGRFAQELRSWIEASGLSGRVHLAGPVSDVRPCYAACDVVVNSRLDAEPFGLSVIEAMHCGRPVLAHRLGGPAETVRDGETGWLIDAPDLPAFEAGIRRALSDRHRWAAMGETARADARRRFTTARMIDEVLRLAGLPPRPEARENGPGA